MKGDFSRVTFDPRNHFSQVLLQQGRVTLDADPNEQGAILLHYLRTMARDLFGPYGGPVDDLGYLLTLDMAGNRPTLVIGAGRYYVDGILCESDGCNYLQQPHYIPSAASDKAQGDPLRAWLDSRGEGDGQFWIYLDVWERHVTAIEHPSIREVALGGPDTCSRVQVIWQVRSMARADVEAGLKRRREAIELRLKQAKDPVERARLDALLQRIQRGVEQLDEDPSQACGVPLLTLARDDLPELAARINPGHRLDDPCITSPESDYRGAENHLYRIEIHQGSTNGARATFKWSRDNGSVTTRWLAAAGDRLTVASSRGFSAGQWVELSSDEDDLLGRTGPLLRVANVEGDQVTVEGLPVWADKATNAKLRRWDQVEYGDVLLVDGAVPVGDGSVKESGWIDLEDGIQIRFAPDREYRSGDYWLIPARVATGGIEWPVDTSGDAVPQPPRGVEHHYAPLGFIGDSENGEVQTHACLCTVYPASSCGVLGERMGEGGRLGEIIIRDAAPKPEPAKPAPAKPEPVKSKSASVRAKRKPKTPKPPA